MLAVYIWNVSILIFFAQHTHTHTHALLICTNSYTLPQIRSTREASVSPGCKSGACGVRRPVSVGDPVMKCDAGGGWISAGEKCLSLLRWLQPRRRLLLAPAAECDFAMFGLLSGTIMFTINKLSSVIAHVN